jgi:N-acetylglucosaminyl-diphospho-decaprenol L-rhamnosyltransferase
LNKVAAIIINRNTAGFLRDCLQTLKAQDFGGGISIWVVDNGSEDGSPQMVLKEFEDVNLVWNRSNVGYARACNQGVDATTEPFVFVMNSDTALADDTVEQVVGYLQRVPEVGIAGPLIRNTDGSLQYSCREFPSIGTAFVHAFLGLFRGDNPRSVSYKKMSWDHAAEVEVDWVSGAFMGIRREALEQIGGFDEGYYMYVEDVDVCWRMWQAGWSVGFVPRGDVFHHHRSMLRFHRRTYDGPAPWLVTPVVSAGVVARFALIMALNTFYRLRGALGGAAKVIMPGRQ